MSLALQSCLKRKNVPEEYSPTNKRVKFCESLSFIPTSEEHNEILQNIFEIKDELKTYDTNDNNNNGGTLKRSYEERCRNTAEKRSWSNTMAMTEKTRN